MKDADDQPISLIVWSAVLSVLQGTDFTEDDVYDVEHRKGKHSPEHRAALALHHLIDHEHIEGDEDRLRAVLKAANIWRNADVISPADVTTMADHFACYYGSQDDALDDHLREYWNDLPITYLSDHGRKELLSGMRRNDEIWVDEDNITGIHVFARPEVPR
jgi:hypothetical protein